MNKKELKKIAKERKIKLKSNMRKRDIQIALGMEPLETPKRYDHCKERKPAQKVVVKNTITMEERTFNSIFETANHFGLFAGSITWRMKKDKSLTKGVATYIFHRPDRSEAKGGMT